MQEDIAKDMQEIDGNKPEAKPEHKVEHFGPCLRCEGTGLLDSATLCPVCAGSGKALPSAQG